MKRLGLILFSCLQLVMGEELSYTDNSIGMTLVDIPAGSFYMGSPEDEPYRTGGETLHKVTLTQPFKVGIHEVTQGQWERLMGYGMQKLYERRKSEAEERKVKEKEMLSKMSAEEKKAWVAARKAPDGQRQKSKLKLNDQQKKDLQITRDEISQLKARHKKEVKAGAHLSFGDNFPIGFVSWSEAVEFCEKLTAKEHASGQLDKGWSYRLPTEAEWEYVCRADTQTPVLTGDQPLAHDRKSVEAFKQIAWNNTNAGDRTYEVGQLLPNPWGLYDIYGNVTEWCLDIYAAYSSEDQIDPIVLKGPSMMRMTRGLNAHCTLTGFRSATRKTGGPRMPFYALFGFRVVCAPITEATSQVMANHTNQ